MRKLLPMTLGVIAVLSLACGGGDDVSTPAAPAAVAPQAAVAPAFDPLAGKSVRDICHDNGLTLIKWDFDALQADFAGVCCGDDGIKDQMSCELDWPFSDVPPCVAYDAMRNHIYARYGYDFQDKVWADMFETQPWYQQRTDFDAAWLSPVAAKNVAKLKQLKADKVACEG